MTTFCTLTLALAGCGKKNADTPVAAETPVADSAAHTPDATATPEATPDPDQGFFDKAAEGGMAEVEAGQLAQEKASSAEVKKFGAMMVTDHTQANDKLTAIAANHNVTLPTDLNAEHQQMKDTLGGLSGKEFDKQYIAGQIKDHRTVAELLRTESTSGQNPDAKAFAAETLPTVEAHLRQAESLGKKLKVKLDPPQ
jgi:putative membrane protein